MGKKSISFTLSIADTTGQRVSSALSLDLYSHMNFGAHVALCLFNDSLHRAKVIITTCEREDRVYGRALITLVMS